MAEAGDDTPYCLCLQKSLRVGVEVTQLREWPAGMASGWSVLAHAAD